jgi:hypothetical protein
MIHMLNYRNLKPNVACSAIPLIQPATGSLIETVLYVLVLTVGLDPDGTLFGKTVQARSTTLTLLTILVCCTATHMHHVLNFSDSTEVRVCWWCI